LEDCGKVEFYDVSVLKDILVMLLLLASKVVIKTMAEVHSTSTSSSATSSTSEELVEDVIHIGLASASTIVNSLLSKLIILRPFLGITEHLIGIGDLLELLLGGFWIIFVFVWMVLDGQFLELLFNLFLWSIPRDS
jgi:hypothetical protein